MAAYGHVVRFVEQMRVFVLELLTVRVSSVRIRIRVSARIRGLGCPYRSWGTRIMLVPQSTGTTGAGCPYCMHSLKNYTSPFTQDRAESGHHSDLLSLRQPRFL